MKYINRTDISDSLVIAAYHNGRPDPRIEINELVICNKREPWSHGQFGWYFQNHRRIVVYVPPKEASYIYPLVCNKHGGTATCRNREEMLVTILAHELMHADQYQIRGDWLHKRRVQREREARMWEANALNKWRNLRAAASKQ